MGRRFRKSIKLGPLRINLSKSGVGYSVGNKFYRVTKKADGGYRTTSTLPGTGLSNVTEYSAKQVEESEKMREQKTAPESEPTKKKSKSTGIIAGAAALLLVVGAVAGSSTPEDDTPDTPQVMEEIERDAAQTSAPSVTPAPVEDPAPVEEPTPVEDPAPVEGSKPVEDPAPVEDPKPVETPKPAETEQVRKVYRTKTGKRYHYDSSCNGGDYYEVSLTEAKNAGLTPCKKCAGG